MLVNIEIKSNEEFKKDDLLIYNGNGNFTKISKRDFLMEQNNKIKRLEMEIKGLKDFLKTYQDNMVKLLKGVIE